MNGPYITPSRQDFAELLPELQKLDHISRTLSKLCMINHNTMEDEEVSDTRVFVSGLPPTITSDELGKHFARRYQITDAQVIPGRRIGFVGFRNYTLAKSAVTYFNKSYIRMSKILVDLAKPVCGEFAACYGVYDI